MLNDKNSKNNIGADDPFNKKKLAEEAKREHEKNAEVKRDQDRRKIQLEIDNLERELDRFDMEIASKDRLFSDAKRKAEALKNEIFLLEGKIKKQEGGISYLNSEASSHKGKVVMTETELERSKTELGLVNKRISNLEAEYSSNKANLRDLEVKINQLNTESGDKGKEIKDLESKVNTLKAELDKAVAELAALKRGFDSIVLDKFLAEMNLLKKELLKNENDISTEKIRSDRLTQVINSLDVGSKQVVFNKSKVEKDIQAEEKQIKAEKQELFFKKRVQEQIERDNERLAQEQAKFNSEKAIKERKIQELKRQKEAIR